MEQAVDNLLSLPEVVGQVSAIQKDHNKELERQLMQLKNLQVGSLLLIYLLSSDILLYCNP